jgi:hypothetical protein
MIGPFSLMAAVGMNEGAMPCGFGCCLALGDTGCTKIRYRVRPVPCWFPYLTFERAPRSVRYVALWLRLSYNA